MLVRKMHNLLDLEKIENQVQGLEIPFLKNPDFDISRPEDYGIQGGGSSIIYPGTLFGRKIVIKIASLDEEYCIESVYREIKVHEEINQFHGIISPLLTGRLEANANSQKTSIPFLIFPYQDITLDDMIPHIDLGRSLSCIYGITSTLHKLYKNFGIVHQDVNPSNCFLKTNTGIKAMITRLKDYHNLNIKFRLDELIQPCYEILLYDLGIGMRVGNQLDKPIWMWGYGSPEQTQGIVTSRNDLWGIAVIWLQMLLKQPKKFISNQHWYRIHSQSKEYHVTSFATEPKKNEYSILYALGFNSVDEYVKGIFEAQRQEKLDLMPIIDLSLDFFHCVFDYQSSRKKEPSETWLGFAMSFFEQLLN